MCGVSQRPPGAIPPPPPTPSFWLRAFDPSADLRYRVELLAYMKRHGIDDATGLKELNATMLIFLRVALAIVAAGLVWTMFQVL